MRRSLEIDATLWALASAPSVDPLGELRGYLFDERWGPSLRARKLVPFGTVRGRGFLCFDARRDRPDADWPILAFEPKYFHEGQWDWIDVADDGAIGSTVFSSFRKLLECGTHLMTGPEEAWARRVGEFTAIDPSGAGSERGLAYWNAVTRARAWRVKPPRWKRLASVHSGVDAQLELLRLAQHALGEALLAAQGGGSDELRDQATLALEIAPDPEIALPESSEDL